MVMYRTFYRSRRVGQGAAIYVVLSIRCIPLNVVSRISTSGSEGLAQFYVLSRTSSFYLCSQIASSFESSRTN